MVIGMGVSPVCGRGSADQPPRETGGNYDWAWASRRRLADGTPSQTTARPLNKITQNVSDCPLVERIGRDCHEKTIGRVLLKSKVALTVAR